MSPGELQRLSGNPTPEPSHQLCPETSLRFILTTQPGIGDWEPGETRVVLGLQSLKLENIDLMENHTGYKEKK